MAQTMYSNPTALRPEIGWAPKNALAGMMYHQNEQDYRQRFDQQTRLQDLGEQEQRYDFAEKREGAPLRQMERQLKGETIQGQMPFRYESPAMASATRASALCQPVVAAKSSRPTKGRLGSKETAGTSSI